MDDTPRLRAFAERFLQINAELNLSAARDMPSLWDRHIEDSLRLLDLPEIDAAASLLDLGTGGGLPGLPLAICRPQMRVTLVDSVQKKVRAVERLIDEVGISNATAIAARAEALARTPEHRQAHQVVVARAVARLNLLLELAAPLVALHGAFVAVKGPDPDAEIAEAEVARHKLRLAEPRVREYEVAGQRFTHVIYPVRQYVPRAYPRGNGLPSRRPLGSEDAPG